MRVGAWLVIMLTTPAQQLFQQQPLAAAALPGSIIWNSDAMAMILVVVIDQQDHESSFTFNDRSDLAASRKLKSDDSVALSILDFGGKPGQGINNQKAIGRSMAACSAAGGCSLTFPIVNTTGTEPVPYPYGDGPPTLTTYYTSAWNVTSNLRLIIPSGVVIHGTESFAENCGGVNASSCNSWESPSWPVLPTYVSPSSNQDPTAGHGAKQAWLRGYNLTNVTFTGGGILDGGGPWWWCVRMLAARQPAGAHAPSWCARDVALGKVPAFDLDAPMMIMLIGSTDIVWEDLLITNAPMWCVVHQYSSNIVIRNVTIFNPNNDTIEGPNTDGCDLFSCSNAHIYNVTVDVGDDMFAMDSGVDYMGRRNAIPTQDVVISNSVVRNGHGLTLGSGASGGLRNITYRDITYDGYGGPQPVARRKRPAGIGGIHFKTGRGRGGHWQDITWRNIHGSHADAFIAFFENHGSGYNQSLGPTNATATPTISNMLVENVALTNVLGPSEIFTLFEAPIDNLTLRNCSWTHRATLSGDNLHELGGGGPAEYLCTGWNGTRIVNGLFATGSSTDVSPPLPRDCSFMNARQQRAIMSQQEVADEQMPKLSLEQLELEFDPASGGITRVRNTAAGAPWFVHEEPAGSGVPLWQLQFGGSRYGGGGSIDSSQCAPPTFLNQSKIIKWHGCKYGSALLDVTVTWAAARLPTDAMRLSRVPNKLPFGAEGRIRVVTTSGSGHQTARDDADDDDDEVVTPTLSRVVFPILRLRPGFPSPAANTTLVWSRESGRSWRNPWADSAPLGYSVGSQVGSPGPTQMGCIVDDAEHGLYWATHDSEIYQKDFAYINNKTRSGKSTGIVQFSVGHSYPIPVDGPPPEVDFSPPYPVILTTFRGGWWDASQLYRSWALRQPWVPAKQHPGPTESWLKKIHVWVRGDTKHRAPAVVSQRQVMLRYAKLFGTPIGVQLYNWANQSVYHQGNGSTTSSSFTFTSRWPPSPGWAWADLKKSGVHVLPYVNSEADNDGDLHWHTDSGDASAIRDVDGRTISVGDPGSVAMCASQESWHQRLLDTSLRLLRAGAAGVYMDQSGNQAQIPCFAKNHNHTLGGGSYGAQGLIKMFSSVQQAMRAIDPQAIMAGVYIIYFS
jgi:polygalacturonase